MDLYYHKKIVIFILSLALFASLISCSNKSIETYEQEETSNIEVEEDVENMTQSTEQLIKKMLEPVYINYPTESIVGELDFWDVYMDNKHENPIFLTDIKYEVEKNSAFIFTDIEIKANGYRTIDENGNDVILYEKKILKDIKEEKISLYEYVEKMPMTYILEYGDFDPYKVQRKSYDILCSGRLISARNKDTQEQVSMDEVLFSTYMYSETEEIDKNNLEAYKHGSMDFYMDSYYWGSQKSPKTLMTFPEVIKQLEDSKLDLTNTNAMVLYNSFLPENYGGYTVLMFDGEHEYLLPFYDYKYDISSFDEELAEKVERKYFDDEGNSYHMYLKGETLYEFNDEMLDDLIFFHYDMKSSE